MFYSFEMLYAVKATSPWRFRRFCCAPYAAIFLVCVDILLAGLVFLAIQIGNLKSQLLYEKIKILYRPIFFHFFTFNLKNIFRNSENLRYTLISIGVLLGVVVIANLYTWSRIVQSIIFSQRRRLQMRVGRLQSVRAEGYLQVY